MCFADLLMTLQFEGFDITEAKIRSALRSGRLSRPELDASHRFKFSSHHLQQLRDLFPKATAEPKTRKQSKSKKACQ